MIKDGKDTAYNRLGYYPHYWVGAKGGYACLMRTTNLRDVPMKNAQGGSITGMYREIYELARVLNRQNQ